MFEPTQGCPHLQPLELMQMAEDEANQQNLSAEEKQAHQVIVTEVVPDHMFKCIKTTLSYSGTAWMVSNVERLLNAEGQSPGAELIKKA